MPEKLYNEKLAKQDVKHQVDKLARAILEVQSLDKQLRKAMHRASKYGELSDEQLYYLTDPVHDRLDIYSGDDIFRIVQEEEE